MDVTCDQCHTSYDFDESLVSGRGTTVKCSDCGHQFKVFREAGGGDSDGWTVRTTSGSELSFQAMRDLQAAISSGTVSRQDVLIPQRGGAPQKLGQIEELGSFFDRGARPPLDTVPGHVTSSFPPPMPTDAQAASSESGEQEPATNPRGEPTRRGDTLAPKGLPAAADKADEAAPAAKEDRSSDEPAAAASRATRLGRHAPFAEDSVTAIRERPHNRERPQQAMAVLNQDCDEMLAEVAPSDEHTAVMVRKADAATSSSSALASQDRATLASSAVPPQSSREVPPPDTSSATPSPSARAALPQVSDDETLPEDSLSSPRDPNDDAAQEDSERESVPPITPSPSAARPSILRTSEVYSDPRFSGYGPRSRGPGLGRWVVGIIGLGLAAVVSFTLLKRHTPNLSPQPSANSNPRVDALLTEGRNKKNAGDLEGARETFLKASGVASDDPRVAHEIASIDIIRADQVWLHRRLLAGESPERARLDAQLEAAVKRARRAMNEASAHAPDSPSSVALRIDMLRLEGQADTARGLIPLLGDAQETVGRTLAYLDLASDAPNFASVIERLRDAARTEKGLAHSRAALIYALGRAGRQQDAKTELESMTASNAGHPLLMPLATFLSEPDGSGGSAPAEAASAKPSESAASTADSAKAKPQPRPQPRRSRHDVAEPFATAEPDGAGLDGAEPFATAEPSDPPAGTPAEPPKDEPQPQPDTTDLPEFQ